MDRNVLPVLSCIQPSVAPYVGTWIEIVSLTSVEILVMVVPYVGTWIEIQEAKVRDSDLDVVPYVGTWIEIWIFL